MKTLNVKLTKIESNHNNLRTNDMVGTTSAIPEVGHEFSIFGESLSFHGGGRVIHTTIVKESDFNEDTKTFRFKTQNSTYELEVLDKDVSTEKIKQFSPNNVLIGFEIMCIDPIEDYITEGKSYEFLGFESYAGRAVIIDDTGKEGHYKPERFLVLRRDLKYLSEFASKK